MQENCFGEWFGTVKDLKEWLTQFEDFDEIIFTGGSNSGEEFLQVLINGEEIIYCGC